MTDPTASAFAATVRQPALERWGDAVGRAAAGGSLALPLVVLLRGTLGAGKSVLARAMARGAGVTARMPSPTYNLLFTYEADPVGTEDPVVVHHLDLYRLRDPEDVWELGWQELGVDRELVLIEWPERAESLLPPDHWDIELGFLEDPGAADVRSVRVTPRGDVPAPPPLRTAAVEEAS